MLIDYHRTLVADKVRNDAFYKALSQLIQKGRTVVADVGSGSGILGFMASRLGAKKVYLYEQADVMGLSQAVAAASKIPNCRFIHSHSAAIEDPAMVDVIVSETLGNYAFEEQIIETIEDSKRFLNEGGAIIPQRVEQFACPVTSDRFFRELTLWDDVGFDIDFSEAKIMSLNNIYVRSFAAADLLDQGQAAQRWDEVDFRHAGNHSNRDGTAQWTLTEDAPVFGFAVWWRCELVPGLDLSTSPLAPKTHWEQLYFPVLEPLQGRKGDTLSVTLSSRTSYEEGTILDWRITLARPGEKPVEQSLNLVRGYLG